jgi:hypothetical protein
VAIAATTATVARAAPTEMYLVDQTLL